MGINFETNMAAALAIDGIVRLAKNEDYGGFFAAMDFLTGENIEPPDVASVNIFDEYESAVSPKSEGITRLLDGLRTVYDHGGYKDALSSGIDDAVAGLGQASLDRLKNALWVLELSANQKSKTAIRNSILWLGTGSSPVAESISPELVCHILSSPCSGLSFLDKAALYLAGPAKKIQKAEIPQIFKIPEREALLLAFAASVDNLVHQYAAMEFMGNNRMCHDFFIGLANFVSPRKMVELNFNHLDGKGFSYLLEAYGFEGKELERMDLALEKFPAVAEPRSKFWQPGRAAAEELASAFSCKGSISIMPEMAVGLRHCVYNLANPVYVAELQIIAQLWDRYSPAQRAEAEKIAEGIMKTEVPMGCRVEMLKAGEFLSFRNYASMMNETAVAHCTGLEGAIRLKDAQNFLMDYFSQAKSPFEENKIMELLRHHP